MKICSHCGNLLSDSERYCNYCGTRVDKPISLTSIHKGKRIAGFVIGVVFAIIISTLLYRYYATSSLKLSPNSLEFLKYGGTAQVEIEYDGFRWSVENSPQWLSLEAHNRQLYVTAEPNTTGELRSDSIIVVSGSQRASVLVSQTGRASFIGIYNPTDSVSCKGDTITMRIQTDGIKPEASIPSFCRIVPSKPGSLTIAVLPNDSATPRVARIVLAEDNCHAETRIFQDATKK